MRCIDENNREINIKLNDVLYRPDLIESLLLVRKLVEKGLTVQFQNKECKVVKDNVVVATAILSLNMYALEAMVNTMAAKQISHTENCQHTWHRRFGHRHVHDVQLLQNKNLVLGITVLNSKGMRVLCERQTHEEFISENHCKQSDAHIRFGGH